MTDFPPHCRPRHTLKSSETETTSLGVKQFYGVQSRNFEKSYKDVHNNRRRNEVKGLPNRLNNLLGPSQIWRVFQKQSEALEFAKHNRSGLMTFAFQKSDGTRSFLVAHPKIFWHYDSQKKSVVRHTFEVIPDSSVCKLYFDLEFDVKSNPGKSGPEAVNIFITLVLHFLYKLFNIHAIREHILDLDSTTDEKFSRHLIFQLSSCVFCNNLTVGEFVALICKKLQLYLRFCNEKSLCLRSGNGNPMFSECPCCQLPCFKNIGCIEESGLSVDELKSLEVVDKKGKICLLCDLSVYSKNRHFRLFQNTKWGKNIPLVLSDSNCFKPTLKIKASEEELSEAYFLDSLISYQRLPQGSENVKIINLENKTSFKLEEKNLVTQSVTPASTASACTTHSPFPEVDHFINTVVFPGHIRKCAYFCSTSVIVYDIVGNRYCQNIGRQHRSNNIKFVVDLKNYLYYQKCYDLECSSFCSNKLPLPPEVKFKLNYDFMISDNELTEIVSVVEDLSNLED